MSYQEFAVYYDFLMDPSFYEEYERFIRNIKYNSVIELGCGTGNLAALIANENVSYTGVDLSSDMIDIAIEKNIINSTFIVNDMSIYTNEKSYDLCLCICDSINYLHSKELVEKTFQNAFCLLEENGTFVCDTHSLFKVNNVFDNYAQEINEEDFYLNWRVKKIDSHRIKHFVMIETEDARIEEIHDQYIFDLDFYKQSLLQVGFKSIKVYTDFLDYNEQGLRHILVCRKGE